MKSGVAVGIHNTTRYIVELTKGIENLLMEQVKNKNGTDAMATTHDLIKTYSDKMVAHLYESVGGAFPEDAIITKLTLFNAPNLASRISYLFEYYKVYDYYNIGWEIGQIAY